MGLFRNVLEISIWPNSGQQDVRKSLLEDSSIYFFTPKQDSLLSHEHWPEWMWLPTLLQPPCYQPEHAVNPGASCWWRGKEPGLWTASLGREATHPGDHPISRLLIRWSNKSPYCLSSLTQSFLLVASQPNEQSHFLYHHPLTQTLA